MNNLVGCGDWTQSCKQECINDAGPIPRIVHFLKLDGGVFTVREWISVMSARKFIKPKRIVVYSVGKINGSCWWRRTLPFVEHHILPKEVLIKKLNGVTLQYLAHQSDFIRNSLLYHIGGVYADTDMIIVKPLDALLEDHQAVVSREDTGYVSSALMLLRRNSCFMCTHARRACENYDGWWLSHATITLHKVAEQKDDFPGLNVISNFKHGFCPISCTLLTCGWRLFGASMESISFNLSQAYSIHLMNAITKEKQKTTLQNYEWISTSHSAVAAAVRKVLPPWFNATYLDETRCIDLPKEERTDPISPMFVLKGIPTQPAVIYNGSGLKALVPRAYIACLPTGYGFCIELSWVLLVFIVISVNICFLYLATRCRVHFNKAVACKVDPCDPCGPVIG